MQLLVTLSKNFLIPGAQCTNSLDQNLEGGVLELYEGDEEPPGVRSVHDEALQEDPGDLRLDGLGVGLGKQVEETSGELGRVRVGIAQRIVMHFKKRCLGYDNIENIFDVNPLKLKEIMVEQRGFKSASLTFLHCQCRQQGSGRHQSGCCWR